MLAADRREGRVGEEMVGDGREEGRERLEVQEGTSCSWDVDG